MKRRSLKDDTRAAVYVEFLVVFMPMFTLFLGMIQVALIFAADNLVQHAADAAGRSAIVVLPDDPARYGGPDEAPKNQISWDDNDSDSSSGSTIAGMDFGGTFSFRGDSRLNTIRWAAWKPLLAIAPTPQQAIDSRGSDSVREAIGEAGLRLVGGLAYNITAVSVTFPSGPGAEDAQISGTQSFSYSRDSPSELTTRVTYLFNCAVPLAAQLMCDAPFNLRRQSEQGYHELGGAMYPIMGEGSGFLGMLANLLQSCFHILRAESTMLYQGAEYQYASEQGAESDASSSGGSGGGGSGGGSESCVDSTPALEYCSMSDCSCGLTAPSAELGLKLCL